jgi:hypothetical protein
MSNLVPVTTRILAPGAILASGMILMMGAPTDALLTFGRIVAGAVVLPVTMVAMASIAQSWWLRRHGQPADQAERSSIL